MPTGTKSDAYMVLQELIESAHKSGRKLSDLIGAGKDASRRPSARELVEQEQAIVALLGFIDANVRTAHMPAHADRDDLVHAAFVRVMKDLERQDITLPLERQKHWLKGLARNAVKDAQRSADKLTRPQRDAYNRTSVEVAQYSAQMARERGSGLLTCAERDRIARGVAGPTAQDRTVAIATAGTEILGHERLVHSESAESQYERDHQRMVMQLAVLLAAADNPTCNVCRMAADFAFHGAQRCSDEMFAAHEHLVSSYILITLQVEQ